MARFGEIGKQYFDDAGDPLILGTLEFFESGSTTAKDTFRDVSLSLLNTNPVILTASGRQPNIFFNGSARVVLRDSVGQQIEEKDPEGGEAEEGVFSPWNALTIYNVPDIVIGSDVRFYVAIVDGSQNKDPTVSPTDWTQIRFIRVYNTNETYSIGQIVGGSDSFLYASVTDNNTGNDPVTDTINWKPAVKVDDVVIPAVVLSATAVFAYQNLG